VFGAYLLLLTRGAAWLDGSSLRGLTPEQRAAEIDSIRGYLIQYGAGAVAFGALVYTARNFRLSREGHVTDRYTKAIEQLGSDHLDVRLGAIYALERIMIDSARDHPIIVEVLAAYIREHTSAASFLGNRELPAGETMIRHGYPDEPEADVQAALIVLGRRPSGRTERGVLDLRGAYLRGAYLVDANLIRANLTGANLSHADLRFAKLVYAQLFDADLAGADLMAADLTWAYVTGAKIETSSAVYLRLTDDQRNSLGPRKALRVPGMSAAGGGDGTAPADPR
jgi:hypothetical protein